MYIAKLHQETDRAIITRLIEENGFGLLITTDDTGTPHATHIPMVLEEKASGELVLKGHIARINPQWQWFSKGLSLAVFNAEHAYISASWYEKGKIPTWNYMAVHLHGTVRIQEEAEVIASLGGLVDKYEAASACPVHISEIPAKELDNNVKAIVGFELTVTDINATFKLSQNKNDADYQSVITHLREIGDENAIGVVAAMEARRPQIK
ncbi:FMN-binding negative transcriptional regulator [Chitinophaga nivalis]|uniref:FMN-binding negative transcriptional regulator n=1 Tax=Chitinophaga nivalis TaxID=2991709 RepID=A0ABT3IG47_9BACT|nr:FMN-binding negative transcriptional regulator [Chitinophaga nivalis]MCW3467376.1 FMN-binding negative transcriptional regulator [Chitinophaga nivalis]MCW3482932.1 FMN-binding negative transcriptional regulator [Chitinophaga nivalis]